MGPNIHGKSAISITLDNNVLQFFSGKGRSGRINEVLTQYLRWNFGEKSRIGFKEEITDRARMTSALNVVMEHFGEDSSQYHIMKMLWESIE